MSAKTKKKKTKEDLQTWVKIKTFVEEGVTFMIIPASRYELLNMEEESTKEVFIFKVK